MRKLILVLMSAVLTTMCALAQTRSVSGTVVDADTEEPLIGVTVMPVGSGQGVVTDIDGKFSISLPASVKELKFTYVGMKPMTVAATDGMTVKMSSAEENLQDLVVVGYGSAKKLGSVVGSVAVVGDKTFENVPTTTFVDALQGQVAGLNIYSNSGDPSSTNQSVQIRGVNSLNAGNTPLYILDGAPVSSTIFTTLNPNDIQSVTVLKDAASVAIYGSRASNGVIVITSKKGAYGSKPKVTLSASAGWSQMVGDNLHMMNSQEYVKFRDLIGQPVTDEARHAAEVLGISTDWRKETFNSSAPTYQIDASMTGGGENLSYYISLNHSDQDGIIAQSGMRRETLRATINAKMTDWLRIGLQTNLGYTKYETNSQISSSGIYTSNPMVFARFTLPYDSPYYYTLEGGKPVFGDWAMKMHYSGWTSPEFIQKNRDQQRSKVTANINLFEQITPISGLILKAQQNVDAYDYRFSNLSFPYETYETPMGDIFGEGEVGTLNTGYNQQSFERYYSWTYTHTAEYNFILKDVHDITLLAGEESIFTRSNGFGVRSEGQTDKRLMLLTSGTTVTPGMLSESRVTSSFNSLFFKADYNYDNRYFIEASYRRDGSSKFAPEHRWSNFYSVGAMWNIKNEKFLEPYEWVNDLQLRVSYGTTGNSFIDDYLFFGSIGQYGAGYGPDPSTSGATGLYNPANHKLTWETVESFDAGVHLKALNKLDIDFDFYRKTTKDMLMAIPWSMTTGFDEGWGNIGSMRNTGFDLSVNANIFTQRDWSWSVRAAFNYNKNTITELFNGRDSYVIPNTGQRYAVGHSAGEFYTVRYLGVDPADGKQVWLDKNDNPTKVWNEENNSVMTGKSLYAPVSGGFGTSARWKGFGVQLDFNWAAKKYMTNNDAFFLNNAQQGGSGINQTVDMLNVWTKPGDVTIYPGQSETIQFDSRFIEDASFLRLKNLTVTYNLPQTVLNTLHLSNVMLHFTGRNLWTVTNFTGYDPEPQTNVYRFNYPNTRIYEFGLDLAF